MEDEDIVVGIFHDSCLQFGLLVLLCLLKTGKIQQKCKRLQNLEIALFEKPGNLPGGKHEKIGNT